ncbi:flap structure-specific endonuclease, partial [Candidatus Bathyarchaeota archaeon]
RRFLCDERGFSPRRVETLITRMRRAYGQRRLEDWL